MIERFRWVAGVIAAHEGRKVYGRTRLQKTIKLLQRVGLPADYTYLNHFYGPYSPELQSDIGLLQDLRLLQEDKVPSQGSATGFRYVFRAEEAANLEAVKQFQEQIKMLEPANSVVLELAATYDSFREMGADHGEALERLHRKKGSKCDDGREGEALALLKSLGLLYE